jgi:hypothetical protein
MKNFQEFNIELLYSKLLDSRIIFSGKIHRGIVKICFFLVYEETYEWSKYNQIPCGKMVLNHGNHSIKVFKASA